MLTKLSVITSNILNHVISQLYVMWKSGYSTQWNSFGIAETPDDGRLGPKLFVKGRRDRNSRIFDGIILCIRELWNYYVKWRGFDMILLCLCLHNINCFLKRLNDYKRLQENPVHVCHRKPWEGIAESIWVDRAPVCMYYGNTLCTIAGKVVATQGEHYTLRV
jgi:hypothetical protein